MIFFYNNANLMLGSQVHLNHIIYQDSMLLVPVVCFAQLVLTGLLTIHHTTTQFLLRPARKESKVPKLWVAEVLLNLYTVV